MPSPAHPLGWQRALHPRRSPCRVDADKGNRQHRCSSHHAAVVESYRAWREYEQQRAEECTSGYQTELADHWRDRPRPTFGAYLAGLTNPHT